jgi:hypothetical protein
VGTFSLFHPSLEVELLVAIVASIDVENRLVVLDSINHASDASECRLSYSWCLLRSSRLRALRLDLSIIFI